MLRQIEKFQLGMMNESVNAFIESILQEACPPAEELRY